MKHFRTGLMLGAMALMTGTGAGVSAQGIRIDQMPGAYNRDEAPDRAQPENNGYPPGVVATPPKGTMIDPPQGNAAGRTATAAPRARATPAAASSGIPTADEIASVYARTFAAGTNGLQQWVGGGIVRGVQPFVNIELGRWEYRVSPSSVSCTKTKAPGHRCKYTIVRTAIAGEGFMSQMSAAFAQGMTQPMVINRTDQFVRGANGVTSTTLAAGLTANRAAYASSNSARYADERQRAEEERLEQMRRDQEKKNNCYYEQSMGLPQLNC
jgi:hypothetical protein